MASFPSLGCRKWVRCHFIKNYQMTGLELLRQHSKHKTVHFCEDDPGEKQTLHMRNLRARKQKPIKVKEPGGARLWARSHGSLLSGAVSQAALLITLEPC